MADKPCWGGSCTAAPLCETRNGSATAIPTREGIVYG
jgi:hypothetical protein